MRSGQPGVTPRRPGRALGLAALLLGATALAPVAAEPFDDGLLTPTPLILRDGRIAHVSVHVVPFDAGEQGLGEAADAGIEALGGAMATDCFLTAQVIGHVEPGEAADADTLAAHRLARARADAVQAALVGRGLPERAIASVWDWQFLVQEPRATLWVFRLTEGEDCDGVPLDPDAEIPVAELGPDLLDEPARTEPAEPPPADPEPEIAAAESEPEIAAAEPDDPPDIGEPEEATVAALDEVPVEEVAEVEEPAVEELEVAEVEEPAVEEPEVAEAEEPAVEEPEVAEAEEPAVEEPEVAEAEELVVEEPEVAEAEEPVADEPEVAEVEEPVVEEPEVAEVEEPTVDDELIAAAPADEPVVAAQTDETMDDDALVIPFDVNSSYFGSSEAQALRGLVGEMATDGRYRVELVATVGAGAVRGAESPEEALRYNRWLADRRIERIEEWLIGNAPAEIDIDRDYLEDDASRRVLVRVRPLG